MKIDDSLYELFKKEAEYWLEKFGLTDWNVNFSHEDLNRPDRWSQVSYNWIGREVTISLNTQIDDKEIPKERTKLEKEIRKSAFHEIMHLVLADLEICARSREFNVDTLETILHACIHRLEKVLFDGDAR